MFNIIVKELPKGVIIHIEGIPFKLEKPTAVSGQRNNFYLAEVLENTKQTGTTNRRVSK